MSQCCKIIEGIPISSEAKKYMCMYINALSFLNSSYKKDLRSLQKERRETLRAFRNSKMAFLSSAYLSHAHLQGLSFGHWQHLAAQHLASPPRGTSRKESERKRTKTWVTGAAVYYGKTPPPGKAYREPSFTYFHKYTVNLPLSQAFAPNIFLIKFTRHTALWILGPN